MQKNKESWKIVKPKDLLERKPKLAKCSCGEDIDRILILFDQWSKESIDGTFYCKKCVKTAVSDMIKHNKAMFGEFKVSEKTILEAIKKAKVTS